MPNPNRTYHCTADSMTVYYTDTQRHFVHPYESKMDNLQLYGNSYKGVQYQDLSTSMVFESDHFSPYQNRLYKQAILGLKLYTEKELLSMSFKEKWNIERLHRKAQKILNDWKQLIIGKEVDSFLSTWFPHSRLVKGLIEKTKEYTNDSLTNYQSFSDLGISKEQIAQKLVETGILPRAFFKIKSI